MYLGTNSTKEKIVTDELIRLGIPRNILGYEYLKYAIFICIEDQRQIHSVTKGLYPAIARKYDTLPSRVERAIRHAIEVGWSRADLEFIEQVFGYSVSEVRGKPTNSEFIASVSDDIRIKLKTE